ncbi:MAG: DUF4382 domain-containing protein [Bacteroidota bacterium]
MKKLKLMAMITMAVLFFVSCEKSTENHLAGNTNAMVEVMLAGESDQYNAVNIDIQEVYLKNEKNDWVEVPLTTPGVYNLTYIAGESDVLLGKAEMPDAMFSQVRIVMGTENSVVVDGVKHPLDLPVGDSDIILDILSETKERAIHRFWIDFDIPASIKNNGQDRYIFKPFFRIFSEASSGNLTGSVYPVKAMPIVKVFNESETMYTYPASNGKFMMRGVPAGTYIIEYSSGLIDSDYLKITKENVEVSSGKTTELEPVVLNFLSKP